MPEDPFGGSLTLYLIACTPFILALYASYRFYLSISRCKEPEFAPVMKTSTASSRRKFLSHFFSLYLPKKGPLTNLERETAIFILLNEEDLSMTQMKELFETDVNKEEANARSLVVMDLFDAASKSPECPPDMKLHLKLQEKKIYLAMWGAVHHFTRI
eukprot:TRINITY_DN6415_c0_g1_i1.p1 TRINITY_DN6415_c0_g1~~TRINITY_DN6415_c0_g1_i1.p1  ORF type:complete len:166 (-),score=29.04 TRINITY_DN6415_c0_g1_i1:1-474(-)